MFVMVAVFLNVFNGILKFYSRIFGLVYIHRPRQRVV
jgi:hypothetical protein